MAPTPLCCPPPLFVALHPSLLPHTPLCCPTPLFVAPHPSLWLTPAPCPVGRVDWVALRLQFVCVTVATSHSRLCKGVRSSGQQLLQLRCYAWTGSACRTDRPKGHNPVSSGRRYLPGCMQCKLLPGLVMMLWARWCTLSCAHVGNLTARVAHLWVTLQHVFHICCHTDCLLLSC